MLKRGFLGCESDISRLPVPAETSTDCSAAQKENRSVVELKKRALIWKMGVPQCTFSHKISVTDRSESMFPVLNILEGDFVLLRA